MTFVELVSRPVRLAVMAACLLALVLGAAGVTSQFLFAAPTTAKYAMTILAPLLVGLTCVARRPLRVLVAAAIVLGPFASTMALRGFTLTPLGLLLAAAVVVAVFEDRPPAPLTPTSGVVVAVVALMTPALVLGSGQWHYGLWLAGTIAAGWLAFVVARETGGRRFVFSWVAVAALLQAVLAIYESVKGVQLALHSQGGHAAASTFGYGEDYFRPAGTLQDPIALGNVLAFACPITLGLALTAARARWAWAWAWATVAGIIAFALLLTYSRFSWIGGTAGVVAALVLMPPRARVIGGAGAVACLALVVSLGLAIEGQTLRERYASIADPTARTNRTYQGDRERQQIWHSALSVFKGQPATGTGLGRLQPALGRDLAASPNGLHAHSVYLQILASAGLAGALALALLLGHIAITVVLGLRTDRTMSAALCGALLAMLIPWLTDTSVRYAQVTSVFAFCFGAALAQRWWPSPLGARAVIDGPQPDVRIRRVITPETAAWADASARDR